MLEQIQSGDLNFAIVPDLTSWSGVRSTFISSISEVLISSHASGRTSVKPVVLAKERASKLILPPSDYMSRAVVERYLQDNGVEVHRVLSPDAPGVVEAHVAESDWSAIQPAVVYKPYIEHRTIVINPFVSPGITFGWIIVEPPRRQMSAIARIFLERLRAHVDGRVKAWVQVYRDAKREVLASLWMYVQEGL